MNSSRKLLERLAIFRELSAEEQAELLRTLENDPALRNRLDDYRQQEQLIGELPKVKPDSRLRHDFYSALEERQAQNRPSFGRAFNQLISAGGRFALAAAGLVLIVAAALVFRSQLLANATPQPGAIGRPQPSSTPTEAELKLTAESELLPAGDGEAPVTSTIPPYPGIGLPPTPAGAPYPGPPYPGPAYPGPAYPGLAYPGPMPTGTRAATPVPAGESIMPVLGPLRVQLDAWSAAGRFLAFWEHQPEDFEVNGQYPPGTLTFYEPASGRICVYPRTLYDGEGGMRSRHVWLDDERLLVFFEDGAYSLGAVCTDEVGQVDGAAPAPIEEIVATDTEIELLLARAEDSYFIVTVNGDELTFTAVEDVSGTPLHAAAFSPAADLLAIHSIEGGTIVVDVATGEVLHTLEWQSLGGLGDIFAPQWLDEQTILVRSSAAQGAFIWTIGGDAEPVGPTLLDHDPSPSLVADGVPLPGGGYALVGYYVMGVEPYREGIWYYSSGMQAAQELPFDRAQFSSDGQRVLFFSESDGQGSANELWWASTAEGTVSPEELYAGLDFPYTAFPSRDSSVVAVAGNKALILDSAGETQTFELTDVLYGGVPRWSPQGEFVATAGGYSGRPDNHLYVIPVR